MSPYCKPKCVPVFDKVADAILENDLKVMVHSNYENIAACNFNKIGQD